MRDADENSGQSPNVPSERYSDPTVALAAESISDGTNFRSIGVSWGVAVPTSDQPATLARQRYVESEREPAEDGALPGAPEGPARALLGDLTDALQAAGAYMKAARHVSSRTTTDSFPSSITVLDKAAAEVQRATLACSRIQHFMEYLGVLRQERQ